MSRKSHTNQDHEKLFESYTLLSLGITILQGWQQTWHTNKYQTTSFPYPTHLDPRFPDKVDINKINLHTGKIGTSKKKWMPPRFQINIFKFLLQKDTRFCSQTQNKMQQAKNYKVTTNILSFTFLQPTHGSNIILPDCRFILQSKNLFCHHVCRYPVPQNKNKH